MFALNNGFLSPQCSNDSVLAAVFHPMDTNLIVTCGKSHINFWTIEGNTLTKRQGLFEVPIRVVLAVARLYFLMWA